MKRAAWKPSCLQDGVEGPKMSPRWPKLAPKWAQKGSKIDLAWIIRCVSQGFRPILNPSRAMLDPPWPILENPKGPPKADFGLSGAGAAMLRGKKVRLQKPSKTIRKSTIFEDSLGQEPFRSLAKRLFGGLVAFLRAGRSQDRPQMPAASSCPRRASCVFFYVVRFFP